MSFIAIVDLEVFYRVGISDEERAQPQRLLLTIDIKFDFSSAAMSGRIGRTIDYYEVSQRLLKLGENRSWRLIESVATDVANKILAEFQPDSVTVEVKKFSIPEARYVSISLTKQRPVSEFKRPMFWWQRWQGGTFLQIHLVPAIQAHAHAMIFGWMGLFVMGFAYQSFPRFKYVTLWRPDLANLTLYLMLIGIASRVGAEMLQPMPVGVGLGILAAATELAAITLFIVIILKTAQQSVEPHQIYEKFIFGAFFWFFVQAIVSDLLFFAKVTAVGEDQLVMRIALIDGPLRDIQLLGFGALIIAGVSQRFVPAVYGLGKPRHDRQSLIFWLINASLVLDVASYVLLFSTGNLYFSIGLELAFILMAVWAVLLVMQIRVFAKTSETDRSLKFIRAAYAWLLFPWPCCPSFWSTAC